MDERTPLPLVVIQAILKSQRELDRLRAEGAEIELARKARAHRVSSTDREVREDTEQEIDSSPLFICDNCGHSFPQNLVKPWARNRAQPIYWLCPECVVLGRKAEELLLCEQKAGLPVNLKQTSPYSPRLGTLGMDKLLDDPVVVDIRNAARKLKEEQEEAAGDDAPKKRKKRKGMKSLENDW